MAARPAWVSAHDDIAIDNVVVTSTRTTTTSVTSLDGNYNWTASYTENGLPVSIADTDNSIIDADSSNLASATVTLTNAQAGDRLLVNGSAAASGTVSGISYTISGTTVTLSGSATKANYEAAIRAIQFDSTSDAPSTTPRNISVVVNDGTFNSNTAITTINVTALNDAPVNTLPGATEGSVGWNTNEDTNVSLTGLSVSDVDAASGTITVTLGVATGTISAATAGGVTVGGSGTASLTLTGTLANINAFLLASAPTYTPVANANGSVTLTMTTNDGGNTGGAAQQDADTRSITINAVNDAPTLDLDANNSSGASGANFVGPYVEGTAGGVFFVDGDRTIGDVDNNNAASATIVLTNAQAGDVLSISGALPAGITSTIDTSVPGQITLTLTGSATRTSYQAALSQLRYSSTSDNPTLSGTVLTRNIQVTVSDGALNSNTAISTINVIGVNDAPVDGDETNTVIEDTTRTVADGAAGDLLNNATDPDGNPLTITAFTIAGQTGPFVVGSAYAIVGVGTLTINANGSYSFAPLAKFTGAIPVVTYTVSDGALADTSTLTLTMTPVNDAPVVDLNSGQVLQEQITNGGFPNGAGWTVSPGGWTFPGLAAYIDLDTGTHTLTSGVITGLNNGAAPSGSAQVALDLFWNNSLPAASSSASTLNVIVGGVLYARVVSTTGAGTSATITYFNGATGNFTTATASIYTSWLIDLPSTVSSSGTLVFEFVAGGGAADDFRIDNVSIKTFVDATAGTDFSTTYTENGAPVSIADTDNTILDVDDTNMELAVIALTNPQAGDRLLVNGSAAASGTVNGISYTISGVP